ncbi:MAG TPA: hypothetical protein VF253_09465 [Candidatus Limnocylindrales bacterium]
MTLGPVGRDGDIEAFVVDRYLESLLAREPRDLTDIPADVGSTAEVLAAGLQRYHPSFRFVEGLSAKLAAVAAGRQGDAPVEIVDLPVTAATSVVEIRSGQVHPVVIGGVLTSAAISIAGAAYVAWRRGRLV